MKKWLCTIKPIIPKKYLIKAKVQNKNNVQVVFCEIFFKNTPNRIDNINLNISLILKIPPQYFLPRTALEIPIV